MRILIRSGSVTVVRLRCLKRVQQSPRLAKISLAITFFIVPVMMMWKVLFINQNVHLANPGISPTGSTITDLDGAARMAYLLSDMSAPWALTHFVSSPIGAGIWRFQSMSQMIQIFFLWVLSHLVQPMLAANLLVLLGWAATGSATFLIARNVGCKRSIAISCAVAVQMAPSMRFTAANFTSYVNIAVPLFCLLAALKFSQIPNRKSFGLLLLSLLIAAFYDPYWLLFAIFGCTVVLLVYACNHALKVRTLRSCSVPALVLCTYALVSVVINFLPKFLNQGSTARSIEVASRDDVRNSVLNWSNWSQSEYTGIGWLVLALFLFSVILVPFIEKRNLSVLTVTAVSFVFIASKVSVPFTPIEITPALWFRQIMPGVRFFDRAGLIAIPLLIVVSAKSLEEVFSRITWARSKLLLVPLLVVALPLSYPNLAVPSVTSSYDDWASIRSELDTVPEAKVLALPFERRGRDWIEQASFRVPLVNDLVTPIINQQVILHASNGAASLASFLNSLGVTHVFSIDSELARFIDYQLEAPRFNFVERIRLNGFGEGADFELSVYRVVAKAGDSHCTTCELGPHIALDVQVTGDLVYPPEITADGQKRWWLGDRKTQIAFYSMGEQLKSNNAPLPISFTLSLSPCTPSAHIKIIAGDIIKEFDLDFNSASLDAEFELGDQKTRTIEIFADGEPCSVPGDGRRLLIQLSDLKANF